MKNKNTLAEVIVEIQYINTKAEIFGRRILKQRTAKFNHETKEQYNKMLLLSQLKP